MATIKAIEGRTVHQIQSGQVIVDICSVVKELVENSLDAGATSIDVRFKNHGLDSIEVQDNGEGISPNDHDTLALKHYTSKLSTYSDLSKLQTFGFRGEALSSLCALSKFHVLTARVGDGSKGTRLDYETSGKLKKSSVIASQKGTTIVVETLFSNLPVRRRELEKNIKREYSRALGVLNAYACISTGVRFVVSNVLPNGKKTVAFSTNLNTKTRENIANVFGAKTLAALVPLDLKFDMEPTSSGVYGFSSHQGDDTKSVQIIGHISRPSFGEGRQTPDRQMFFVNSRPCGLPQIAKVFNEVYKSYNMSQSPFVFADIRLDTNAYDVNVSPDKRTILLHDQNALLENLKASLTELFDKQDQIVPQSLVSAQKLPAFKQLSINPQISHSSGPSPVASPRPDSEGTTPPSTEQSESHASPLAQEVDEASRHQIEAKHLLQGFVSRQAKDRIHVEDTGQLQQGISENKTRLLSKLGREDKNRQEEGAEEEDGEPEKSQRESPGSIEIPRPVQDFNTRLSEASSRTSQREPEEPIASFRPVPSSSQPGVVQNAFDRMRPRRATPEMAIITIGSQTSRSQIGTSASKRRRLESFPEATLSSTASWPRRKLKVKTFVHGLKSFAAPGTQAEENSQDDSEDDSNGNEEGANGTGEDSLEDENEELDILEAPEEEVGVGSPSSQKHEANAEMSKSGSDSDGEYIDDEEKKAQEDAKVAKLIKDAENEAMVPSEDSIKRADAVLKGGSRKKDSTVQWTQVIETSSSHFSNLTEALEFTSSTILSATPPQSTSTDPDADTPEASLSLIISKSDFSKMLIAGQFNLGFILATRSSSQSDFPTDLFIIDQHASDEKYNFERLQATTIVQNQRLVQPLALDLTAIEEETILDSLPALEKNGFLISIDTSGATPVGKRCHLLSLPMSKEVVFNSRDLEELLVLLAERSGTEVPRPTKVRKMFAMRACRSSIMIGKTLNRKQMQEVVRHMGEIEKPWNCPHGRPTMRHVVGLGEWESWDRDYGDGSVDWASYT